MYGATIRLDILRKPLMDESRKELQRGFQRLRQFAQFQTDTWKLTTVPEGKLKDLDHAALTLAKIVSLVLDESIDQPALRSTILNQYAPDDIQSAVTQVNQLVRNDEEPIAIEELLTAYRKFRKFILDILATITFAVN